MAYRSKRGEQKRYGWFRCSGCNRSWESASVWVHSGSDTPKYGQECQTCRGTYVKPYKVEPLRCSICGERGGCDCDKKNVDPEKPHRADLCERCKSGRRCQNAY